MLLLNFGGTVFGIALFGALLWTWYLARAKKDDLARLKTFLTLFPEPTAPARNIPQAKALPFGLQRKLQRAGVEPSTRQLIRAGAALMLLVAGTALAGGLALGLGVGLTALSLGWGAIEYRAHHRMRLLSDYMIGFFERIRQLLVVGNSLAVSLQRATENSPPIVSAYLAPAVRRISNGTGVGESIEHCATELDLYELHFLATAARTNLRFGGSMSNILHNIIETLRRRAAIERELRASTAEIRASAWILAILPILVSAIVIVTNHAYAEWFLNTKSGHHMLVYAALSQLAGIWCMRRITRTQY